MDFLSQLALESLRLLILYDFNVHVDNVEDMFAFTLILCFIGKIMCLLGLSIIPLITHDYKIYLSSLHAHHWKE